MREILRKQASVSLEEESKKIDKYRHQKHQTPFGLELPKDCLVKYGNPRWKSLGLTETLAYAVERFSIDIVLYNEKQAQYGDTVASYSTNGMIDQTIFKVVAAHAAYGMGKMDIVFNLMQEIRMYSAMVGNRKFSEAYKDAISIIPYKEIYYASAWKLGSIETILDVMKAKMFRHQGLKTATEKTCMDMNDMMNYALYIQMLIQSQIGKVERVEDDK